MARNVLCHICRRAPASCWTSWNYSGPEITGAPQPLARCCVGNRCQDEMLPFTIVWLRFLMHREKIGKIGCWGFELSKSWFMIEMRTKSVMNRHYHLPTPWIYRRLGVWCHLWLIEYKLYLGIVSWIPPSFSIRDMFSFLFYSWLRGHVKIKPLIWNPLCPVIFIAVVILEALPPRAGLARVLYGLCRNQVGYIRFFSWSIDILIFGFFRRILLWALKTVLVFIYWDRTKGNRPMEKINTENARLPIVKMISFFFTWTVFTTNSCA